ncbi:MAG: hypothetical protein IJD85_04790 [Oscillospiraceae bacterium]|nr:hypothetical protein [Oscillospiraceae bacterium]
MLRRITSMAAAVFAAAVLSASAFAANGGVVGNVVDAGENIVNDVVDAGENVVDDVTDAVTGEDDTTGGNTNSGANGGNTDGNTSGSTGGAGNGTTSDNTTSKPENGTGSAPEDNAGDIITGGGTTNPNTGVPFAFAAVAALAVGGAGIAVSMRRDD